MALDRIMTGLLRHRRDRLARDGQLLNSLGYRQVLSRGFALIRDSDGQPIRSIAEAKAVTAMLDIEFADGHMEVTTPSSIPSRRSRPKVQVDQGSLFEVGRIE